MHAARNTINARNVTEEPNDNFYAATELLNKFDAAYFVCGGLHHSGMQSLESDPVQNQYTGEIGNQTQMCEFVLNQAKSFLETFLSLETPTIPVYGPQNNSLLCRFCIKTYKKKKMLRKHESTVHGAVDPLFVSSAGEQTVETESESDGILSYTKVALLLGLLRRNHTDAIKLGDGQRIMDTNMYLYLLYKVNNCPKYAYGI